MIRLSRTWPGIDRSAWAPLNQMATLVEKMANSQTDGSIVWNIDESTMYVPEPEEFEAVILTGTNPYSWAKLRSFSSGAWYVLNQEEGSEFGNCANFATATIQAATWAAGIAGFILDQDIGVVVGDAIYIKGVEPNGYDGTYTVLTSGGTAFTVALAANPGTYTTGGAISRPSTNNTAFREAYECNSNTAVPAGTVVWIKPRYLTDGDGTDQEYKFRYQPCCTADTLTQPQWWNEIDQWWPALPQLNLIQDEGTALPRRPTTNYIGAPVTATDNAVLDRTDVTITLSSATLPGSIGSWWQNLLINGGFNYAQRQTPGTLTTITDQTYSADRWKIEQETAGVQYKRFDATAETAISAKWYGQFKKITNAGKFLVSQWVLGQNSFPMRGQSAYYTIWLKSNGIRNIKASVLVLGSGGTINVIPSPLVSSYGPFSFVANVTAGSGSGSGNTLAVATTWTGFGGVSTAALSTSLLNIGFAFWTEDNFAVGDTLDVAMVQMGLGDGVSAVKTWMERHVRQEQALCQHFYRKSFNLDTAPAQNVGAVTGELAFPSILAGALGEQSQRVIFDTPMYAAPTITLYNPAAANAQARDETAAADCAATVANDIRASGFDISATGNILTAAGNKLGIHWSAVSEL